MRRLAQQRLRPVIHTEQPIMELLEKRFHNLLALLQPFIRWQVVNFTFYGKGSVAVLLPCLDVGQLGNLTLGSAL